MSAGIPTADELILQAQAKLVLAEELGIANADLARMVHAALGCLDVGLAKTKPNQENGQ